MTKRTTDMLIKIAIEVFDWINILLKEKRRKGKNDRKRTTTTE
jgi:hypothetical protein